MPELFTKCERCDGTGHEPFSSFDACTACNSTGLIPYDKTTEQVEKVIESALNEARRLSAGRKDALREAAEEALREIEEYLGGGIGTGGLTCAEADLKQALKAEGGDDE